MHPHCATYRTILWLQDHCVGILIFEKTIATSNTVRGTGRSAREECFAARKSRSFAKKRKEREGDDAWSVRPVLRPVKVMVNVFGETVILTSDLRDTCLDVPKKQAPASVQSPPLLQYFAQSTGLDTASSSRLSPPCRSQ